jgi:hypothetical protein
MQVPEVDQPVAQRTETRNPNLHPVVQVTMTKNLNLLPAVPVMKVKKNHQHVGLHAEVKEDKMKQ